MEASATVVREIAVPVSIFATLREELAKEAGALATIHAMHHAGYEAGAAAATSFGGPDRVAGMAQDTFWRTLSDFFSRRGWGTMALDGDPGEVALLSTADWAEADPDLGDAEASCSFSTGFLSGLLSSIAGGPVAVLEVECRSRGQDRCRFAFGSEQAIHDLYGRLLDGTELGQALTDL